MSEYSQLVSCSWLADRLEAPDIKILDASNFLPTDPRDPYECFLKERIPNARFFDINDIADKSTGLSHSMPKPETFMSKVSKLGVGDGFKVVIYDANGSKNAAMRAWWMFRHFGHTDVAVLDGGLPKWKEEGYRLADGAPIKLKSKDYRYFTPREGIGRVLDAEAVQNAMESQSALIVDVRSPERYAGELPEPRPCEQLGHIPGSINVPNTHFFNDDMTLKSPEEIKEILTMAGVPLDDSPVIASCGTGVTACVLIFVASLLGKTDIALYDGSWEDWGNIRYLPANQGLAP